MVIQMFFCGAGGLNKMHYGLCENNEQAINLGENYISQGNSVVQFLVDSKRTDRQPPRLRSSSNGMNS